MSSPWVINNYPATNTAATASQLAPTGGSATCVTLRMRALMVTLSAGASPSSIAEFVVRDGASGVGTILMSGSLSVIANLGQSEFLLGIDLRATPGNALTIEFTGGGGANTQESVWAEGDIIPVGLGYGKDPN